MQLLGSRCAAVAGGAAAERASRSTCCRERTCRAPRWARTGHAGAWPRRSAGALLLLHVGSQTLFAVAPRPQRARTRRAIAAIAGPRCPAGTRVGAIRRMLEPRLLEARAQGGRSGMLPALQVLSQAMSGVPGARVRALNFRDGTLQLKRARQRRAEPRPHQSEPAGGGLAGGTDLGRRGRRRLRRQHSTARWGLLMERAAHLASRPAQWLRGPRAARATRGARRAPRVRGAAAARRLAAGRAARVAPARSSVQHQAGRPCLAAIGSAAARRVAQRRRRSGRRIAGRGRRSRGARNRHRALADRQPTG